MHVKRFTLGAAAGLALIGAGAAAVPGAAGASTGAHPVPATALVTGRGTVVTPAAAARLAGTSVRHDGHAPSTVSHPPLKRPNSIIGTDNRFRVTATTSYPNSAVVLINRNGGLWCTGWMISKDTLLSAGHCVTDGAGTWYSGLTFVPGSNGGTAPFGTYTAKAIYAFSAWASGADSNYDTSIIKLNTAIGNSTGWFGTWWQSASEVGLSTDIQGYPGDKPSQQWGAYDYVRSNTTDRLSYQNDTVGGDSGSPVFQYRYNQPYCDGYCGMGVHTNGSDGTNNSGTRFTQGKLNAIYGIANS